MNTLTFHDSLWSYKHILQKKNESKMRFAHSRPSETGVKQDNFKWIFFKSGEVRD